MKNRKLFYVVFALFFLLEGLHLFGYLIPAESRLFWLVGLGHWAPVALAFLLFILVQASEHEKSRLQRLNETAEDLLGRIDGQTQKVESMSVRLEALAQQSIELSDRLKSSDVLIHGKLLFFQRQYAEAIQLFEDAFEANQSDLEVNKWLGLSLLRDRRPKDAIGYLERAAKGRVNDPELWFACGEAKFRSWDVRYRQSGEGDIETALRLGLRQREGAQIVLAKLQLNRDRDAAKKTLRDGLSRNPQSFGLIRELSRVLLDDGAFGEVVEIVDKALGMNKRNWSLYPVRALAFIRRDQAGDLERAQIDVDEAKKGNPRDFEVLRADVELLLARARKADSPADSRSFLTTAIERITSVENKYSGSFSAQGCVLAARVYIMLGESEKAITNALRASQLSEGNHPVNYLLLCAGYIQNRSWVLLSKTAQKLREYFPTPAFQVWSSLYILLAGVMAGEKLTNLREEFDAFVTDLHGYSGFNATVRMEWRDCDWTFDVRHLTEAEKKLALLLTGFLKGTVNYTSLLTELERQPPH